MKNYKIIIAGGGPSGLFCAYNLIKHGIYVELYEKMTRPGIKLMLAGGGGLNITNNKNSDKFHENYGKNSFFFKEIFKSFNSNNLEKWLNELNCPAIKGNGGKIIIKEKDVSPFIDKWLNLMLDSGYFAIFPKHTLVDIKNDKTVIFRHDNNLFKSVKADFIILALGGASRPETGSDGKWADFIKNKKIDVTPFEAANCELQTNWSNFFKNKAAGKFIKNIRFYIDNNLNNNFFIKSARGEIIITKNGIEGNAVYPLCAAVRETLKNSGKAIVNVDVVPDIKSNALIEKFKIKRGKMSASNYLAKKAGIKGIKFSLIRELLGEKYICEIENNPALLKALKITFHSTGSIEKAISTAGGINMNFIDNNMMLKNMHGIYCIGEMVDWEAPTGGYLLQGCFSTAYKAACNIMENLFINA